MEIKHQMFKDAQFHEMMTWLNTDIVREQFNDWDFSPEGRIRQARRMFDLCEGLDKSCIADFVVPTRETRQIFNPDIIIWMNTIKESKYTDTNAIFKEPNNEYSKYGIEIKDFNYSIEEIKKFINDIESS